MPLEAYRLLFHDGDLPDTVVNQQLQTVVNQQLSATVIDIT